MELSSVSLETSGLLRFTIEKTLSYFGKDDDTRKTNDWLRQHIEVGLVRASNVQGIGMTQPIPIDDIYQKTRLYHPKPEKRKKVKSIIDLVKVEDGAVIVAGPGAGKSTLMHWAYLKFLRCENVVPLLFILRLKHGVDDLSRFINELRNTKVTSIKEAKIILLVDGYDEIPIEERKRVSELLVKFLGMQRGVFVLTCRKHYSIIDLQAPHYHIDRFSNRDAKKFARAFFKAHSSENDAGDLISELTEKGFGDFIGSPLMLTLACVLKTGPLPELPKRSIGLLRRALDTLTFRWDEGKGVSRDGKIPLDGDERIRCLMKIAYSFKKPVGREEDALHIIDEHLQQLQRTEISTIQLLEELAQWYGLLVPTSDGEWEFVHRTLHDYLAARYWVESGEFWAHGLIEWDTRAAYAACLVPDATEYLKRALIESPDDIVFAECLANGAAFDSLKVAQSMIERVHNKKTRRCMSYDKSNKHIIVSYKEDIWSNMSTQFLDALIQVASNGANKSHNAILALSLAESLGREIRYKSIDRKDLRGYLFTVSIGDRETVDFRFNDVIEDKKST